MFPPGCEEWLRLDHGQLSDPERLHREAVKYAVAFAREENDCRFWVGCRAVPIKAGIEVGEAMADGVIALSQAMVEYREHGVVAAATKRAGTESVARFGRASAGHV